VLKQDTTKVWQTLQGRPELRGFVLIGGSALALHLHHRESEDLDFAYTQARLPQGQLHLLRMNLPQLHFAPADDPLVAREADDCGLDLRDFSQTFLVNDSVKVTFFVLEPAERQVVSQHADGSLQIASLDEIYALKVLVSSKRTKTRDWFDLYILMKNHGYTFRQFHQVFVETKTEAAYDLAVARLCSGQPPSTDEGFESLLPDPPTAEIMGQFFTERKNRYEQETAEEARRQSLEEQA